MKTENSDWNSFAPPRHSGRGKAVLIGLGLDDPEGHLRFTRGDDFKLLGGSEKVHSEMLRQATIIKDELARRGFSLDNITLAQVEEIRFIVDNLSV